MTNQLDEPAASMNVIAPSTDSSVKPEVAVNKDDDIKQVSIDDTTDDPAELDVKLQGYIRNGRFPTAGRSLESKISEAHAFLERETKSGNAGVGIGVAVVYKDKVVLNKGYGLRHANDSSSAVATSTLFQIGSVTKTFVALGIAVLVDDGKLAWRDPVIKHLPTLELFDKYAEQHVTIGDLLAMNSGLGRAQDLGWFFGTYATDKDFVAALGDAEPQRSLRSEYEYGNPNYAILGQVIEHVSGLEWDAFLQQRIWEPLGMTRTFSSSAATQSDLDIASGHVYFDNEVISQYDVYSSPEVTLVAGVAGPKLAAGSMLSSVDDMAKFLRLLLNKGSVDGVTILRSPSLVTEMTSGKTIVVSKTVENFALAGHHFVPGGNTLATGYGFDAVGHALWGHAYFDKGGDTSVHTTRTGFTPDDEQLGVVIMANSQARGGSGSLLINHMRSYLMGIFLDIPKDILDLSFAQWRAAVPTPPTPPGMPMMDASFWKHPPNLPLSSEDAQAITGVYAPPHSLTFYGTMTITATPENHLVLQFGQLTAPLSLVHDTSASKMFLASGAMLPMFVFAKNADSGKYEVDLGLTFTQQ